MIGEYPPPLSKHPVAGQFYLRLTSGARLGVASWCAQEGNIFTDAELHVHSVSMLGYSVLAGVGVSVSSIILRQMISDRMFRYATYATQLGTLLIIVSVREMSLLLWLPHDQSRTTYWCWLEHIINRIRNTNHLFRVEWGLDAARFACRREAWLSLMSCCSINLPWLCFMFSVFTLLSTFVGNFSNLLYFGCLICIVPSFSSRKCNLRCPLYLSLHHSISVI